MRVIWSIFLHHLFVVTGGVENLLWSVRLCRRFFLKRWLNALVHHNRADRIPPYITMFAPITIVSLICIISIFSKICNKFIQFNKFNIRYAILSRTSHYDSFPVCYIHLGSIFHLNRNTLLFPTVQPLNEWRQPIQGWNCTRPREFYFPPHWINLFWTHLSYS